MPAAEHAIGIIFARTKTTKPEHSENARYRGTKAALAGRAVLLGAAASVLIQVFADPWTIWIHKVPEWLAWLTWGALIRSDLRGSCCPAASATARSVVIETGAVAAAAILRICEGTRRRWGPGNTTAREHRLLEATISKGRPSRRVWV